VTRAYLGLAANGACFLVVGYSLLHVLGLTRLRRPDLRLVGVAYLGGWAVLGIAFSLALIVGIPLGYPAMLAIAAALAAAGALAGRLVRTVPLERVPRERNPFARAAAGLALALLAVSGAATLLVSVQNAWTPHVDVMSAWLPRAEIIYYSHSLDPAAWQQYLTPWYPPLASAMYAAAFQAAGGFHPSILPLQQTLLGFAFLAAVFALIDRYVPRWLSLPSLALLLATPWFWWRLHSLLPDQTLAYLLVVAAIASVLWLQEGRRAWLGLAVTLLAAASLTKIEGAIFGALLTVVVVATGAAVRRRAALPALVLLLGPAALLPWRVWLAGNDVAASTPDYNTGSVFDPHYLAEHADRLTYAVTSMLRGPFVLDRLTTVLACIAIVTLIVVARQLTVLVAAVTAWLALSFAALAAIYWTSRIDVSFYVGTSAPRVATTLLIAAMVLSVLLLGLDLRRARGDRVAPAIPPGPGRRKIGVGLRPPAATARPRARPSRTPAGRSPPRRSSGE
jgi:hypothetical protein